MHQSSNMFHPHSSCHHCPCDDEENYYQRPCPPIERPCCHTHPTFVPDCNCNDPDNYYQRPCGCSEASCCSPSCCQPDLSHLLCEYTGKKVIICIGGTRMRVVLCEVCGTFVKALRIGCGRTLFINICKIDDIHILC